MKAKVVRLNKDSIYSKLRFNQSFIVSTFAVWEKNLTDGPVIFSLKYKKRRRLVKGELSSISYTNCDCCGPQTEFAFKPYNLAKFLEVMAKS
jgi:hypothetical protein